MIEPLEAIFSRAWRLLRENPAIALPPVLSAASAVLVIGVLFALLWPAIAATIAHPDRTSPPPSFGSGLFVASFVVAYVSQIVIAFWAIGMVFGMADAAWTHGRAAFADGWAAVRRRSGAMLLAFIGFIGLSLAAVVLALPTLGFSLLALFIFGMYAPPAIVSGGRGGFAAIGESFRLVRGAFVRSAIGILMLFAIQYALQFIAVPFGLPLFIVFASMSETLPKGAPLPMPPVPLLVFCGIGYVLVALVLYAYYGYYALVLTGMYRSLAGASGANVRAADAAVPVPRPD